jgi:hypothetical protein
MNYKNISILYTNAINFDAVKNALNCCFFGESRAGRNFLDLNGDLENVIMGLLI